MHKELVLFTSAEKKLGKNVKGGPARKASEALYVDEIEQLSSVFSIYDHSCCAKRILKACS